jgi:hypothetical protein
VPSFVIWDVAFDERNRHATNRATEAQIRSVLSGTIEAARNKKGRSASYLYRGVADDGSHWTIAFNYDPATQTARPITAF